MNNSFFELPQEKQMRIINAGFEVFSTHPYKRAVTDNIAAKAGISKGLLFYYFHNKQELFNYLLEYSEKAMQKSIQDNGFEQITDFFELMAFAAQKKAAMVEETPYILNFFINAYFGDTEDAQENIRQKLEPTALSTTYAHYFKNIDTSKFRNDVDMYKVIEMLLYMTEGYLQNHLRSHAPIVMAQLMAEFEIWSKMLKRIAYKEEYI